MLKIMVYIENSLLFSKGTCIETHTKESWYILVYGEKIPLNQFRHDYSHYFFKFIYITQMFKSIVGT